MASLKECLENKYLVGNERIAQAIKAANAEESMENFRAVVSAIQDRMLEDGHFMLPVVHPNGNPEEFYVRTLRSEAGENFMVAYTSDEEAANGEPTEILSYFIDSVLEIALGMEGVSGMVLDPWGERFVLNRAAIQMILEAKQC